MFLKDLIVDLHLKDQRVGISLKYLTCQRLKDWLSPLGLKDDMASQRLGTSPRLGI